MTTDRVARSVPYCPPGNGRLFGSGCSVPILSDADLIVIETAELARKRAWNVMLIAYGDDSSDETKSRVFAASAIVGRQADWDLFVDRWKARNGVVPFHATDCDSDQGDYARTEHASNKKLYADNIKILVDSPLMGAGVSISIEDYRRIFPFAPPDEEWPYYVCFGSALACVAKIGQLNIPPDRVTVTFDGNRDRAYNADRLYDFMVHQPVWEGSPFLDDTLAFGNHRYTIGLQAADLLAREAMKDLDNRIGPVQRWTRQSLIELRKCGRFECLYYDGPKLEQYRITADQLHAQPGSGEAYFSWINVNRLTDSMQMRLRFIAEHPYMSI